MCDFSIFDFLRGHQDRFLQKKMLHPRNHKADSSMHCVKAKRGIDMNNTIVRLLLVSFLCSAVVGPQTSLAESSSHTKANDLQEFMVTHPTGASKPLNPENHLLITVNGVTNNARGSIELFSDAQKTKKVDRYDFTLDKGQKTTRFVSRESRSVSARIWTYSGSFQVKLDQSAAVQAMQATRITKGDGAEISKTSEDAQVGATLSPPAPSEHAIIFGDVPLFPGSQVIKTKSYGANAKAQLQTVASPQKIIEFYQQAMAAKGWEPIMTMVQGNQGVLALKRAGRQLVIKAKDKGGTTRVDMALVGQ
jgi:hypothetical protein